MMYRMRRLVVRRLGVGSETVEGLLATADERVGIPMRGGVDSLNVGVAAGIACWVLGRRP